MIGNHVVTVTPISGGPAVDVSCLVDEISIHHGRDDTDSQPEASSATIDVSTYPGLGPLSADIEIGALLKVTTTLMGTTYTRFDGRITDINLGWEEQGDETPNRPQGQVVATSGLADVGRRTVGAAPFPQQLDGDRIAAVMAEAGIELDPLYSDPGTVQILPRDIDAQPALEVAQEVAESAGGVLWQTRDGDVRYADSEHRRGTAPAVELDSCDVLVTPTWRRTTEGLINEVSLGYGIAPEGSEQPRYVASRPESITRYGRYAISDSTVLAAEADATAMGQLLLTRNSSPVWIMGALPVDMKELDVARTHAVLGLDVHDLVALTGLPAAGTAPTSAILWVEGLTERLTFGGHELELVVSGYCRTVPPPRWDDLTSDQTWDSMGELTWDQMACMPIEPGSGRWNDVPASLRWDQVDPALTWDEWTG